jgi:hypothetical protein
METTDLPAVIDATPLSRHELSPMDLLAKAVERGADVSTLERLADLAERMKAQQAREAFNASLAAFQAECPPVIKTHRGHNSSYAKLEDIVVQTQASRERHGLHYAFNTSQTAALITVDCRVTHSSGHSEVSSATFPIDPKAAGMSEPQKVASAITYAKRYALMNALGIVVADEDNDAALPNAAPPADTTQPTVAPREQRAAAPSIKDELLKLRTDWCDKNGGGMKEFCAWAKEGLQSDKAMDAVAHWTIDAINACREEL